MNKKLDWNEGAPDSLQAGMLIDIGASSLLLVGNINTFGGANGPVTVSASDVKRWTWIVSPGVVDWQAHILSYERPRRKEKPLS